jgi:hypothetical protein
MMPFSVMAACAQALFVGRVLNAGIVWCNIGMPRDRTYTPTAASGAISSIEGLHLDFGCSITGLNRLAGAAMIRNETGWSPPWLHVCRALCMEWWRVRNFEDTRVLKHFLITLVQKLVKRLTNWLAMNSGATDNEVACFTGSVASSSYMTLDNPGGENHVVDPRGLVSARRYIWAAHMIFGQTGHHMLTAPQNGDLWYGPKEGWTEAVNLAYQVRCRNVHQTGMQDAGFTVRAGRADDRAPMSRRNLEAGATLGLPFVVRVANRHLVWSQSIALALIRMVKCGTIMANHKQAAINTNSIYGKFRVAASGTSCTRTCGKMHRLRIGDAKACLWVCIMRPAVLKISICRQAVFCIDGLRIVSHGNRMKFLIMRTPFERRSPCMEHLGPSFWSRTEVQCLRHQFLRTIYPTSKMVMSPM